VKARGAGKHNLPVCLKKAARDGMRGRPLSGLTPSFRSYVDPGGLLAASGRGAAYAPGRSARPATAPGMGEFPCYCHENVDITPPPNAALPERAEVKECTS